MASTTTTTTTDDNRCHAARHRDDSPGFCWGYDGETTPYYSGGKGWGFWDITRGGRFSCHASTLAVFHRNLYGELNMSGGGGSY